MRKQQGLTLVELMVALVLGLLLIAGIVQIFVSGQSSTRVQAGLNLIQDNGRFAMFFLQQNMRQAGRPRDLSEPWFSAFVTANDPDGQPATRDRNLVNGDSSDAVTVMYQSTVNCLGGNTANYGAGALRDISGNFYAMDQFYVHNNALRCRPLMGAGNTVAPGGSQDLVDGIEDFQVLYGVDADNDGVANVYQRADTVGNWNAVVSVRFAVLASSIERFVGDNGPASFQLLDVTVNNVNDGLGRKVFQSTVEVRNRTPL